ncbi:MAG TPA: iron ABC transporter permease [Candidatus Choladousia intestinigallinarum]|nr:iron ABC transporter permease [Candidatus Choladousia intestinigallinarum]
MGPSTDLHTVKVKVFCAAGLILMIFLAAASLFTGRYPLSFGALLAGDEMQRRVFFTLRVSRTAAGLVGGFALGTAGFVYQTVFSNPLASPDVIGVSSGASAGAAVGILFFSGAFAVTAWAFVGALAAVGLALALSFLDRTGRHGTIVLAGIAVHSLAQTALMCLKLTADPERELASIEYWIMGSLNGISGYSVGGNLILCLVCAAFLFLLHRQILLLSGDEGEARMLGVPVGRMRLLVLLVSTLAVACIISMSGLISFVGLLAPHGARMLTGKSSAGTMLLGGILGAILLMGADILARSLWTAELPVSIFTSLLGAPFLIYLIIRGRRGP